jgi:hypothetical protein
MPPLPRPLQSCASRKTPPSGLQPNCHLLNRSCPRDRPQQCRLEFGTHTGTGVWCSTRGSIHHGPLCARACAAAGRRGRARLRLRRQCPSPGRGRPNCPGQQHDREYPGMLGVKCRLTSASVQVGGGRVPQGQGGAGARAGEVGVRVPQGRGRWGHACACVRMRAPPPTSPTHQASAASPQPPRSHLSLTSAAPFLIHTTSALIQSHACGHALLTTTWAPLPAPPSPPSPLPPSSTPIFHTHTRDRSIAGNRPNRSNRPHFLTVV